MSVYPYVAPSPSPRPPMPQPETIVPAFLPFGPQAIAQAQNRDLPIFLVIGELDEAFADPAVASHLIQRTVPVLLSQGERPDVEQLCQRVAAQTSGEGALPLCALLLPDGRPFLAAPLPPHGFPLEASRLFVWLTQADRRFSQNPQSMVRQAIETLHSFSAPLLRKPYSPHDAAHDLHRALESVRDTVSGGFGQVKIPFVCALRFLCHSTAKGNTPAHTALSHALDAMFASALYDPLDGLFFRATLTDDWRVFVPEKPLAINALIGLTLLETGRRSEAIRLFLSLIAHFSLPGGGFSPVLRGERTTYSFSPEQVCSAIGSEDGLRACRLLCLLRQHTAPEPFVAPSRFSPPLPDRRSRPSLDDDIPPLRPKQQANLTPEDAAFLRRVYPALLRARAARPPQLRENRIVTEECALAATALAIAGKRLGETRFTDAAEQAVSRLLMLPPAPGGLTGLPPSIFPTSPLLAQATCGASASLALALLTLGERFAPQGLTLLSQAIHAFLREDGLPLHTLPLPDAILPRIPAIYDSELPSPAATLVLALRLADKLRPDAGYGAVIADVWQSAAPAAHAQPIACAGLIDAMNGT